jgi:flagellar hook-associated protein 2
MSGISSGTGLISGLPTSTLIAQLMQLERQPITQLQTRLAGIQTQRTAWADLSARLLSAKGFATRFKDSSFFKNFTTTSSNENVLSAVAGEDAAPGTYSFVVKSLVSNHQLIGNGFANSDTTPVGAGTLSIEIGHGRVDPPTTLDQLRAGQGVRRGTIRITDRRGTQTDVDLSSAMTLTDVIDRINGQSVVNVSARLVGERVVLEDSTPTAAAVGNLSVTDVGGGFAAADLGLAQSVAASTITGADLAFLADGTRLDTLNDGNGVRHLISGADFRITQANLNAFDVSLAGDLVQNPATRLSQLNNGNGVRLGVVRITNRSGATAQVDLSAAQTVQDVVNALNGAGIGITASLARDYLRISDTTNTPEASAKNLKIEDVTGNAARDLGIAFDGAASSVAGSTIFRISTIGDVIRAINYAPGNGADGEGVVAALSADGNGITLTDHSLGSGALTVAAATLNGVVSQAAADLGILGTFATGTTTRRDLLAGPDSVLLTSLNGGRGIAQRGVVRVTARDGTTTDVDLSAAQTLRDVLDAINASSATSKVSAAVNHAGNGLALTDQSGGTGNLSIADVGTGTLAHDLGLAGTWAAASVNGGNAQVKYVAENSLLADLNYGTGIRTGKFQITDSAGAVSTVSVTKSQTTLQGIIDLINAGVANVTARVNDTGDGLLITDDAGGTGALKIADLDGGSTAADLRIAGQAAAGETTLDGSYEIRIDIDADDALDDVVSKINSATGQVRASLLRDGTANGYRLSLASQVGGRRGEMVLDAGDTGLAMDTLARAQDAVVFFGGTGGQTPVVITSSTNTLTDVLGGVTLNLVGTSDEAVSLSIGQDLEAAVTDIDTFVTNFNAVVDKISQYTSFNADTLKGGVLLGDADVQRMETRLYNAITRTYTGVPAEFAGLYTIGLTIGESGHLQFDDARFREAYQADPKAVEQLFTTAETGLGAYLEKTLDDLTRSDDGLIARADNVLADRTDLLQSRIDALEILVSKKQSRLEAQFAALETSLATLQSQQSALTTLQAQLSSTSA